ncbi:MAG: hypothetical protein MI922_14595, partial [Bacteroidales bacterium]|nr:hypothetical protein [Bacteroidales bacterium]
MTQKSFFLLCFLTLFSVFGLSQNTLTLKVSNPTDDAKELSASKQNSNLNGGDYQGHISPLDEVLIKESATTFDAGFKTIAEIQGDGMKSPIENSKVTTAGIVTKIFKDVEPYAGAGYKGDLAGFFIQNTTDDGNNATSNGVYIYDFNPVNIGDSVVIEGTVAEYYELTQVKKVTSLEIVSSGNPVPAPVTVKLPLTSKSDFERYEGMLVQFEQELTVIENRNLEKYGELRLSSNGLLYQPTQVIDPNDANPIGTNTSGNSNVDAVNSYLDSNKASFFILDDGRTKKNPNPIPYMDMASKTLAAGSTLDSLTGILFYSFGDYRIHPTVQPFFHYAQREEAPQFEEATLKVASFNVLN